jgi:hypothetical protein
MRAISRTLIGLAVAASSLAPVAATAQKSSYDYRQGYDLSCPRTFAFKSIGAASADYARSSTYDSPFVDERTNSAIAAQLERRGWTRSDDHPDIYVVTRRSYQTEYTAYGPYWNGYNWPTAWWGPYYGWNGPVYVDRLGMWNAWGPTYVDEDIRGTLTIDLEDASTGQLVWRGVGTRDVHEHSKPSSRTKHVNHEVADIFEHFPPSR